MTGRAGANALHGALLMEAELVSSFGNINLAWLRLPSFLSHLLLFAWLPRGPGAAPLAAPPSLAAWQPGRPKGDSPSSILCVQAGIKPALPAVADLHCRASQLQCHAKWQPSTEVRDQQHGSSCGLQRCWLEHASVGLSFLSAWPQVANDRAEQHPGHTR